MRQRPEWRRWWHVLGVAPGGCFSIDKRYRQAWYFPWQPAWWREQWIRSRIALWWRPLRWIGFYYAPVGGYWHEGRYKWDFWRTQGELLTQARVDGWNAGVRFGRLEERNRYRIVVPGC